MDHEFPFPCVYSLSIFKIFTFAKKTSCWVQRNLSWTFLRYSPSALLLYRPSRHGGGHPSNYHRIFAPHQQVFSRRLITEPLFCSSYYFLVFLYLYLVNLGFLQSVELRYWHGQRFSEVSPNSKDDQNDQWPQSTYYTVRGQSYFSRLPKYWPPSPSPSGECVPPAIVAGGGQTRRAERGLGVNILEDERNRFALLQ